MEARVKYFSMNGNRGALIVIIVSFFASDCIRVASKKTGEFVLMGKRIPMFLPSHSIMQSRKFTIRIFYRSFHPYKRLYLLVLPVMS
jgi:hypothetical protein